MPCWRRLLCWPAPSWCRRRRTRDLRCGPTRPSSPRLAARPIRISRIRAPGDDLRRGPGIGPAGPQRRGRLAVVSVSVPPAGGALLRLEGALEGMADNRRADRPDIAADRHRNPPQHLEPGFLYLAREPRLERL